MYLHRINSIIQRTDLVNICIIKTKIPVANISIQCWDKLPPVNRLTELSRYPIYSLIWWSHVKCFARFSSDSFLNERERQILLAAVRTDKKRREYYCQYLSYNCKPPPASPHKICFICRYSFCLLNVEIFQESKLRILCGVELQIFHYWWNPRKNI